MVRSALLEGRPDLADVIVRAQYRKTARSLAEAGVWRQAAVAGQHRALLFLTAYGGEFNLLTPPQLTGCGRFAREGDIEGLLSCAKAAALSRRELAEAIANSDDRRFQALLARADDVVERRKWTLVSEAAAHGSPAMVKALLRRGADPNLDVTTPQSMTNSPPEIDIYVGPLSDRAKSWASRSRYFDWMRTGVSPLELAVQRGEPGVVKVLADANPDDLDWQLRRLSRQDDNLSPNAPQIGTLAGISGQTDTARHRLENILANAVARVRQAEDAAVRKATR
jgi:hypothetical protein